MTTPTRKAPVRRKPAPKPTVGAAAAEAIPVPGTVTYLGLDWEPATTPIGHALVVELMDKEVSA